MAVTDFPILCHCELIKAIAEVPTPQQAIVRGPVGGADCGVLPPPLGSSPEVCLRAIRFAGIRAPGIDLGNTKNWPRERA